MNAGRKGGQGLPTSLFVSESDFEQLVEAGEADLDGEHMVFVLPAGETLKFIVTSAVRFEREVSGQGDMLELSNHVVALDALKEIGGEYCAGSVIVGDFAYEVSEGLLARPT